MIATQSMLGASKPVVRHPMLTRYLSSLCPLSCLILAIVSARSSDGVSPVTMPHSIPEMSSIEAFMFSQCETLHPKMMTAFLSFV